MNRTPRSQPPPMVAASRRVSHCTTVGAEMGLPPFGGYLVDNYWGTSPWFVIIGAVFGFYLGMTHLLQMARQDGGSSSGNRES